MLALLYLTYDATFALGEIFYIYHFFLVDVLACLYGVF